MEKTLLITRPEHDVTTHYLSKWAGKVVEEAKRKGIDTIDLFRDKANRNRFIGILKKRKPKLLVLNGHGNDNSVMGHNNEIILQSDDGEALKGKVIYALSCRSAKILGQDSIAKGASAYLGYKEDFVFMYNVDKISKPTEDKTASLFFEPSNHLSISLLKKSHCP